MTDAEKFTALHQKMMEFQDLTTDAKIVIPIPSHEKDDLVGMYLKINMPSFDKLYIVTANEGDSIFYREITKWERIKYWWYQLKRRIHADL